MSASSRGHARERAVRKLLEQKGWWCARGAGSLGDADVVALKAGETAMMVEVKANKDGGPFHNFRPADRTELIVAAEKAGAEAMLVYYPPHKQCRFIPTSAWPPIK